MPTKSYFTFGQNHIHSCNGTTLDKDIVLCIEDANPRERMFRLFGPKWAMQYDECPDLDLYPRGVYYLE